VRPPVIAYADGADSPRSAPRDVAAVAGLSDPEVLLGWTPEGRPWLASPALRGRTVIAGYALAGAVADGRLHYMPVRLSAVPRMVTDLLPDVALVTGIRRGDRLAFGASAGWGPAAARAATMVVVELDDAAADVGGPEIPGRIVATVPRPPSAEPPPAPRAPDEVDALVVHDRAACRGRLDAPV